MIKINPSILSKTVKAITPKTEKVEEAQIRGTIVYRNQEHFVQLDGAPSNAITPVAEFAEGASDAGFVHGDRVLVLIKNHQAIVTKNLTTGLQAQAAKEASAFTTAITDEGITAQRIIANDTFTNTLRANHITADEIIAGMATIDTLDANYAHITDGVIDNAKIGVADVNDLSANYAHITTGVIDNAKIDVADVNNMSANYAHITNGVIDNAKIGYADVNNLSANYAQIDAANVTDLSAQNAWVNKIMVQTGLLAHEGTVFTLDAIQVNAANITAGTIDVNRLIVTVDGEKYLVEIDPTTHQPSYEKLDGGIVEPRTITADKIVAHDITVQEITTENLVGTNGWINLNLGRFFYGNGANYASSTNAIDWNGTTLKIKGDIGDSVIFNKYSTTTEMKAAIGNAVDDIEVGGRNLVPKSQNMKAFTVESSFLGVTYTPTNCTVVNNSSNQSAYGLYYDINVESGEKYILSATFSNVSGTVKWSIGDRTDGTSRSEWTGVDGYNAITNGLNTKAFSIPSNCNKIRIYIATQANGSRYTISNLKLEKGTKATDWTPALDDIRSTHTLMAPGGESSSSATYAQIVGWCKEGTTQSWNVTSTAGVKKGDTVRVGYYVSNMGTAGNRPVVYCVGTVTAILSSVRLTMTMHGLDTTIIDGGSIITDSITANQIAANAITASELDTDNINNSGLLSTGALTVGARNDVLNSNIEVGGRNLLLGTSAAYTWTISITGSSTYAVHDFYKTYAPINSLFKANDLITISFDWSANATTGNMHLECGNVSPWVWGTIVNAKGTRDAASNFIDISSSNRSGHVEITFKVTSSQTSAEDSFRWFRMRVDGADAWNGKALTISNAKCEFGNKATAWSPALEDDASGKNLMRYTHKLTSASFSSVTGTFSTGSDSRVPSGQFLRGTFSSAANGGIHVSTDNLGWDYNGQMVNGFTYTFSAWVRSNRAFKFSGYGPERFSNKSTKVWSVLANEWTQIWCTGVFDTSTTYQSCSFYINGTWAVGDYLDISSMKLEIGTKPTPWTPAPGDMAISFMHADSNGLRIASGYPATQNQRIQMTAADIDMYDSGGIKRININANTGVTVGRPDKGHTVLNDNGLHMYDVNNKLRSYVTSAGLNVNDTDGSTNVAVFGASARIGKSATRHIEVKDGGMQVYQDSTYVMAHIGYGTTNNGSGTETAPYYTFGHRNSGYANGKYSVCEGYDCAASQADTHAEGVGTKATATAAHSEGSNTTASGYYSHAEGYQTTASGYGAHASGYGTTAQAFGQTAVGRYNVAQGTSNTMVATDNAFIVGNGSSLSSRSNALAVTYQGKMTIAGTLTQGSDRRLKEHISYLGDEAVKFIDGLKPAHYIKDGEKHVGFYAQDVEAVDEWGCMTGEMNGYMTLGYMELLAPMVAYIQRLEKRIEELERSK